MRKNFEFENIPAFDAIKRFQDYYENSPMMIAIQELQKTMDAVNVPLDGVTTAVQTFRNAIEPFDNITRNINQLYEPILQITRDYEPLFNDSMISTLKSSLSTLKMFEGLDFSALKSVADALPDYELISSKLVHQIDFENMAKLRDDGEITDEEIAEEIEDIIKNKRFTFVETWDKIKKSKWFLAMRCILVILAFFGKPVIDKVHEETLEAMGVTKFWEDTGIYETLDSLFGKEDNQRVATEDEAKATVDESKTGNISKQKREDLLSKVKEIRNFISNAPQDENTGNLLSYLSEIEKDINGKKYGLVFEEHREDIDEVLETHTPVLTEETDLFIDNGGQMNFLIEGDNLASLKLLEKTHKGKIDIIYIDPPYNTGKKNDEQGGGFIYDDAFVDENDMFIHSKWLSFMNNRLRIAKRLLKDNGIIFISIGKEEVNSLKVLCDEIFGEKNLLGQVVRRTKTTSFRGNYFALRLDYILCYCTGVVFPDKFMDVTDKSKYTKIETMGRYKGEAYKDDTAFYLSTLETRPNQRYWIECPDGELVIPPGSTFPYKKIEGEKATPNDGDGVWRWEVEQFKAKKEYLSFKKSKRSPLINAEGKQAHWNVYTKSYYCEKEDNGNIPTELILDYINRMGTKELKDLKVDFSFPKPSSLISYLIKITNKPSDITVLDFFAGSGTAGHAVMKLNAQDDGNRKYILCTNNENNISRDVTYERISRVIDKEKYAASLKYYKVDYLPISERMYYEYADELLKHIRELVELENGINFTGNAEIAIVLTDDELDNFTQNIERYSACRKLYMGHDLLPDEDQERIIEENNIEINIIPDYYYRDLQEA